MSSLPENVRFGHAPDRNINVSRGSYLRLTHHGFE
jgi:hypothetical protein